jgi:NADH-quinone oxidoreductase subunit M
MNFFAHGLSWTIFSPLLGIIPLFLIPKNRDREMKWCALFFTLLPFLFSLILFLKFQGSGEMEFSETVAWMKGYPIYYRIGVDGFSIPLILLTTLLFPIVIISSWNDIAKNVRGYLFFLLLLETGISGVFASLDLFLFYVFWEAVLIPMYFLIGIWGGPRRIYAATKFILYTMAGSLLMLAAILYLYFAGGRSFNLFDLYHLTLPAHVQLLLFGAFALAFAIKVPLFPFHTWLPDAHVEAPTGGSVILAGVLLKMGTYGFLRFAMPLFPEAARTCLPILMTMAVIGIVYGSLVSMVQTDLKKLVAYTSVAHLGFVVLGICSFNPQGVAGATIQMINHGISTGALFLLVGMIYNRRHTREISAFGGLANVMPLFTILFLIVTFSSIALPGTNGFIGEFLILLGSFKSSVWFTAVAATGVVFGAITKLLMVKRVFFGPVNHEENRKLVDLSPREILLMVPLVVLIFVIGMAPGFLLQKMDKTVLKFVDRVSFYGKVITN